MRGGEPYMQENDNVLYVRFFGTFSVRWNGAQLVKGRDSQFTHLLQILLHTRENGVDRALLIDELFHDREIKDATHSMHVLFYNFKNRLKEMGFSLEEVRELLDEGTHKPSVKQLEEKIKQVEQLLKNLQDRLILLRRMADSQAKIDTAGRIFVQRLPEIVVASHRQVLAKRSDLTALCAHVLGPEIQRIGCKRSLPIYSFVIEHDEEYKTTDVDTEYCEQVEEMMPDTRLIQFKRLPEIPMAVCMKCYGSYQHWYEQKAELFDYIEKQGYQICGRHRRQYVEGAWNQKDPEKWLTIIQVPVTKEEHKINVPNETFYQ